MRRRKKTFRWLRTFTAVLIIYTAGLVWVTREEKKVDPSTTYLDQLEDSVIVLMGEYPEKPRTLPAQIFRIILLALGVLLFGAVVGKISSKFVTNALLAKEKMKKFKDHIIICNWNQNGPSIIEQFRNTDISKNTDIVVLASESIELDIFDNVYIRLADPTQYNVLKENCAESAKALILLADSKTEKPDDKNALIALAVKHLESDKKVDVHVIAELVDLSRKRHLQDAGVDEFVCVSGVAAGMLAQCALFHNMSDIYSRLLTYSLDTNEIYFLYNAASGAAGCDPMPSCLVGLTFAALLDLVSEFRRENRDTPITLIGLRHNGKVVLNPESRAVIDTEDSLLFMAYSYDALKTFTHWLENRSAVSATTHQ